MNGRGKVINLPVRPIRQGNPTADEAEKALIACGWIDTAGGGSELVALLDVVAPEHFYAAQRGAVWAWWQSQRQRGLPLDGVAFCDAYMATEDAQERWGSLSEAMVDVTAGMSWSMSGYAALVVDAAQRRVVLAACQEGARACHEVEAPIALAQAKAALGDVESKIRSSSGDVSIVQVAESWSQTIDEEQTAIANKQPIGIPRGFGLLDQFGNLRAGFLEIYAARPGMGKSALLFKIAYRMACWSQERGGGVVVVKSLEMPAEQLFDRWVADLAFIPYSDLHRRTLTRDERVRLDDAATRIASLPLLIDDRAGQSIEAIRRSMLATTATQGSVLALVVDYLQLCTTEAKVNDRREAVDRVSAGLKGIAKEFGCGVMAATQLNRGCEARENKRPLQSDLRESGAIEQDADRIFGLYRHNFYYPEAPSHEAEVICLKNRHGKTGTVKLGWRAGAFLDAPENHRDESEFKPTREDREKPQDFDRYEDD